MDRDKIFSACPWAVQGYIVILRNWSPSLNINEIPFCHSPFWIQVHNIPPNRMNKMNAEKMGSLVGSFLQYDMDGQGNPIRSFLRLRAQVDITKPLRTGVFIKREDESSLWLAFKYERLSDLCYRCGRLGHTQNSCRSSQRSSDGATDPRLAFGPWLRGSPSSLKYRAQQHSHHFPHASGSKPHTDNVPPVATDGAVSEPPFPRSPNVHPS